jgi:hypothetical protein
MLEVKLKAERVFIGERFSVSFQRTQRIAGDLHAAPPPPSRGVLPVHSFLDYPAHVPHAREVENAFFIPLDEEEAVYLGFGAAAWKPNALKVGVGGRNAVSGAEWEEGLRAHPQDYLVCPPQLSLEGLRTEDGSARQIVADAAGTNLIRLVVYEPVGGRFPSEPPPPRAADRTNVLHASTDGPPGGRVAETLGQKIEREVRRDPYGVETWDARAAGSLSVYVIGGREYERLTGRKPPPRPGPGDVYGGYLLP